MKALRFLQDSLGARGVRAGRMSRSVSKRGAHAGDEGGAHISERKQAECLCIRVSCAPAPAGPLMREPTHLVGGVAVIQKTSLLCFFCILLDARNFAFFKFIYQGPQGPSRPRMPT